MLFKFLGLFLFVFKSGQKSEPPTLPEAIASHQRSSPPYSKLNERHTELSFIVLLWANNPPQTFVRKNAAF